MAKKPECRVLLVHPSERDGNAYWQNVFETTLRRAAEDVCSQVEIVVADGFESGQEALEKKGPWDLLVSDLRMGKKTKPGQHLIRWANAGGIPAIAVSAWATPQEVSDLIIEYKALDFFEKGSRINWARFEEKVKETLGANPPPHDKRNRLFISYSHRNSRWIDDLKDALQPVVLPAFTTIWDDTKIEEGLWRPQIEEALSHTRVGVLLTTMEALASDFIMNQELPLLLDEARRGSLKFMWIAIGQSNYEATELRNWKCANDPARPIDMIAKPRRAGEWVAICKKIQQAMEA